MTFDIFGPATIPLLLAGAAGGLCRGAVARKDLADWGSAIIVGAFCSLFLSPLALFLAGGALDAVHVDEQSKIGMSGFLAGVGGITIINYVIAFLNIRTKAKLEADQTPPPDAAVGGKP